MQGRVSRSIHAWCTIEIDAFMCVCVCVCVRVCVYVKGSSMAG